jgi:YHS domain-containing protein
MSSVSTSSLAVALVLGLATTAYATTGEFGNQCSWGLANHKLVQTDCSVNTTIEGKTYCFSSQEAKGLFMKDPSGNLAKAGAFFANPKQAP